uniref:Tetraspanin n=1 Tax=Saccoglossus kowalevskii TaxID=10224 RepID=A0ABM0LXQ3_SACKO|nr:PREDICTED: CD9 antigen-like [Saccoglossus kowalevskii]
MTLTFKELRGCGLAAVGLWLLLDPNTQKYVESIDNLEEYYIGTYVMIGCGGLMILVGFLGCCGACCESQCLLCMYFVLLVCVFVIEVGGGVWAYYHRLEVATIINEGLEDAVLNIYGTEGTEETVTAAIDSLQQGLECCGANGPVDWKDSYYNENIRKYSVPDSCCVDMTNGCGVGKIIGEDLGIDVGIYRQLLGMIFSMCMCCSLRKGDDGYSKAYPI